MPTGGQPLPRSQARAHLRVQEGKSMQREDLCTKHLTASFPYSKIPPERPVEHSRCPDPLLGEKIKDVPKRLKVPGPVVWKKRWQLGLGGAGEGF